MAAARDSDAQEIATPHAESADALLAHLESDAGSGLGADEVRRRQERYGPNELPREERAGLARIVGRQFTDPLIYILLIATVVSLAIGSIANAVFIGLVLLINAAVGAFQEFQAESSARALQDVIRVRPRVLRDGRSSEVDAHELVPGDIVLLGSGDAVAADLRLIESKELQTDESMLTGESDPVTKDAGAELEADTPLAERATLLHSGSSVMSGRAKAVVVRTGAATEIGHIAESLAEGESGTPPLVQKLKRLTRWIAVLTLAAVAVLAIIQWLQGQDLAQIFTLAVALAVAAIPAGLPVAITVALSVASARMAERHVIVRRLAAVEGLGSCTLVATDKTGTLTANELTVQQLWPGDDVTVEISGEGRSLEGEATVDGERPDEDSWQALERFALAGALANEGTLTVENGEVTEADGDSNDLAFLVLAEKLGIDRDRLADDYPERERIPFESSKRYAAVFSEHDGGLVAHVKGAPEKVAEMCEGADPDTVQERATAFAEQGYRVLAVAGGEVDSADEQALRGLRLLGLAALIDPLREEVPEAVQRCFGAGVGVRMITGDRPDTALAIGRQLKLADKPEEVLAGDSLAEQEDAAEAIRNARVFARVEPLQKTRIVDGLQRAGHYVAVTGDGVNDAPALDRANIGIAMGKAGTDVARNAADLILTDDNFASIVAGIEQGRVAYDNVRKVVWLLLATGAAEVLLFFLALGAGMPIPLTAIQLLWLNMVTNGIQDVALAFEKAETGVLNRPPRPPDEPIFNRQMIEQVLTTGAYMGVVAFGLYFYLHSTMGMGETEARNLTLLLMVLFENVHLLSVRSERLSLFRVPLRNNPLLIGALVGAQGLHIAAMFIPGLRDVLQIQPVSPATWGILLGIATTLLVFDEALKWLRRRRHPEPQPAAA